MTTEKGTLALAAPNFATTVVNTERFAPDLLMPWARRTKRLESLLQHLGLALGGRPGSRMAGRLAFPVSRNTLL